MICALVVVAEWDQQRHLNAQRICKIFRANNVTCALEPAIRGTLAASNKETFSDIIPPTHAIWRRVGKAGAFLSKAKLLQRLAQQPRAAAMKPVCSATLVLEDDAAPQPSFFADLRAILASPPPNWDLISFHTSPLLYSTSVHPYRWLCTSGTYSGGLLTLVRAARVVCPHYSRDTANLWSARGVQRTARRLPVARGVPPAFDLWLGHLHKRGELKIFMSKRPLVRPLPLNGSAIRAEGQLAASLAHERDRSSPAPAIRLATREKG